MSIANGAGAQAGSDRRPIGAVVSAVLDGFRTLAKQHVELAKLEVAEAASIRGQGAGIFAGAAVVGLYAVGFLAAAGAAALAIVLPVWASILIVGGVLALIAGILVLIGRARMRAAPPPADRTKETLKEDARWAKQQIGN